MTQLVANHLGTWPGQHVQANSVAHRTGGHKQSVLPCEHTCGQLLKAVDRRILGIDIITHLSLVHRPSHRLIGHGYSVAPQVDYLVQLRSPFLSVTGFA